MPARSSTFEFENPYVTYNAHTTKPSITMPQMVEGKRPIGALSFSSDKLPAAGYYGLGSREHTVAYTIQGGFKGSVGLQISITPDPTDADWVDIPESFVTYTGRETTGGAGIAGGFSGAVSRPSRTDSVVFEGNYAWIRVVTEVRQGTLQAVKLNF